MLTLSNLTKSYGGRVLFEDVSLQVNRGDRIGLVGPNGAGKTTLFSVILGESGADTGQVSLDRRATTGFLPQETAAVGDETVIDLATAVTPELAELRQLINHPPAELDPVEHDIALARYDELGGHRLEPKAQRILHGLAFREKDFNRPVRELSGGWVMRAHLAKLLTAAPDLLLLDEPTNHLDLDTLGWFQEHLKRYEGAILFISHDREMLNILCDSIASIERGKLRRYRGNYDEFLLQRAARDEQQLAAHKAQQREIDSLQRFADRFRAKASKASQAQSKLKQIDRMERVEAPESREKVVRFRFPQPPRGGRLAVELKDIDFSYGPTAPVYRKLNFEAERGQRTVLVGPNGAGKSTLLKLLAGVLKPDSGERKLGNNVESAYFAQNRVENLRADRTVLAEASDTGETLPEQTVRTVLGSFLFTGDDVFKPVAVLSGGEKTRLALAKLLLQPPNLMLMDEPTTHLDMASIDALSGALGQYEGTLIFISHDVHFIRAVATSVLHISAGKPVWYPGNYDYFLEKSRSTNARASLTAGDQLVNNQPTTSNGAAASPAKPRLGIGEQKAQKRAEAEARRVAALARRDAEGRATKLEREIVSREAKQKELATALSDPATHGIPGRAAQINRELARVEAELAAFTAEWEEVAGSAPAPTT